MNKSEVKIGDLYEAKVSDRLVPIRIDSEHSKQGWNATNTKTGKRIHIKTAQRLRRGLPGTNAKPETAEPQSPPTKPETTKPRTAEPKTPAKTAGKKRLSALDAAAQVLAASDTPMTASQLIGVMAERNLWISPGGKTPHATLHAAIHREIFKKGEASRFQKVDRGLFIRRT